MSSPTICHMKKPLSFNVLWSVICVAALLFAVPLYAGEKPQVEFLNSGKVLPKNLPFSEAVRVGNTVYLSGHIGVKPKTLELVEGGIEAEAKQTMENIRTSLNAHDLSMANLVKCTVMLENISDWPTFNQVYQTFFEGNFPARSAFGTDGLALGALVEVECIAVQGNQG